MSKALRLFLHFTAVAFICGTGAAYANSSFEAELQYEKYITKDGLAVETSVDKKGLTVKVSRPEGSQRVFGVHVGRSGWISYRDGGLYFDHETDSTGKAIKILVIRVPLSTDQFDQKVLLINDLYEIRVNEKLATCSAEWFDETQSSRGFVSCESIKGNNGGGGN
jgi:hypothetical protein